MAGIDTGSTTALANDVRAQDVAIFDANGVQLSGFNPSRPANAAITTVAASVTSVSLLATNTARHSFKITNNGNATLYVAFNTTATTSAFSIILGKNQSYESDGNGYTGDISGIWTAANGSAVITEVTD